MASPPRSPKLANNNNYNNNNIEIATPKRKTTKLERPSSLMETEKRKKSQESTASVNSKSSKSSKNPSPMRSRTSTGTSISIQKTGKPETQKRKLREDETAITPDDKQNDHLNNLTTVNSENNSSDDEANPRRDSKMARFQEESPLLANVTSSSPMLLRSQRSITEETSQNTVNTSQANSQTNLAGEFHTGCTQQFNSMNFGLNPSSSQTSSQNFELNSLFHHGIPENNESWEDPENSINPDNSSINYSTPNVQNPSRNTQFQNNSTPISRNGAENTSSQNAISTIQSIFASNEPPHIGDSGFDLEQSHLETSFLNQLEPQISTFRLKEYKNMGHLGAGGSSIVYKGAPPPDYYDFSAIKKFENPQETDSAQLRKKRDSNKTQALNEINILEYLHSASHANCFYIIQLFRYEEEDDYTYVQLELMDDSLENLMNCPAQNKRKLLESGIYDEAKVNSAENIGVRLDVIQDWTEQMVAGLLHCHSNGIVHRDIKSGNLLIQYQDQVIKVADFGLSTHMKDSSFYSITGEKRLVDLVGTPANFAPEMWLTRKFSGMNTGLRGYENLVPNTDRNGHSTASLQEIENERAETREKLESLAKNFDDYIGYTSKVDIWALGCVLVHLASGRPLYASRQTEEMIYNETMKFEDHGCEYSIKKAIDLLPEYLKDDALYDSFVSFLRCCFAHSPSDRADASELWDHEFLNSDGEMEPA